VQFVYCVQCGKTVIANALSESTEPFRGGDYRPTQGCRILEFEVPDVVIAGKSTKAEIELWDCSGDHKCVGPNTGVLYIAALKYTLYLNGSDSKVQIHITTTNLWTELNSFQPH